LKRNHGSRLRSQRYLRIRYRIIILAIEGPQVNRQHGRRIIGSVEVLLRDPAPDVNDVTGLKINALAIQGKIILTTQRGGGRIVKLV